MEKEVSKRIPTVVVPFNGLCESSKCQDIFVYLRPESNGIAVESALMRGISLVPDWQNSINLIYLANLPGGFLKAKGVFEEHYNTRIKFAQKGKKLFTPFMKEVFSNHFRINFEDAEIIGSFDAVSILGYAEDELFNLWIDEADLLSINGQMIKKFGKYFIINCDIPAILHKNNENTDIAVMVFRTHLWGKDFYNVIEKMTEVLLEEGILRSESQFSHVFHYSKGPCEQILDAIGFLYDSRGNHLPLENIRFYNFLLDKGMLSNEINSLIRKPILQFRNRNGKIEEKSIFQVTMNLGYEESWKVIKSATAQVLLK